MRRAKTIEIVVKNGLCTQCGTCAGICPTSAIKIVKDDYKGLYVPKLDSKRCNKCGTCYRVCPGHYVDFKRLNQLIFCKEPKNTLIGNYLHCYVGYATDYNVRYNSASGGLITALLMFALEEGFLDGALVTRMRKENPLQPKSFIARTINEVMEASGSKYCPVPANIAVKEILRDDGKFAVVGLPCHVHGIRKVEEFDRRLKDKIPLHFGLFCSQGVSFLGTDFWLNKLDVKKENVKRLSYRSGGWPGGMLIELRDGNKKFIPSSTYWNIFNLFFFITSRCLLCNDQTSELADISFGDAWLPRFDGNGAGWSVIISRTKFGEQILNKAAANDLIKLDVITAKEAMRSQLLALYFKKQNLTARENLFRKKVSFNSKFIRPNLIDYALALFPCLNTFLSTKPFSGSILKHIPLKLIAAYGMPFRLLLKKAVGCFTTCYLED